MPEPVHKSETSTDPSVAKQWDNDVSHDEKINDFYAIADKLQIAMMGTLRNDLGPVGRAMAVAKRSGPDFLFLANANSQKFDDIESNKVCTLYFHDSTTQDWVSVTGDAVTSSNTDSRIEKVYTKATSAWFGDLGDGKHDGGPHDPRMKLIEVQPRYVSYWKHEVSGEGFKKEIDAAVEKGSVAKAGSLRQLTAKEVEHAREKHGDMSSK